MHNSHYESGDDFIILYAYDVEIIKSCIEGYRYKYTKGSIGNLVI